MQLNFNVIDIILHNHGNFRSSNIEDGFYFTYKMSQFTPDKIKKIILKSKNIKTIEK